MFVFLLGFFLGIAAVLAVLYVVLLNPFGEPATARPLVDQFLPLTIPKELKRFLKTGPDKGSSAPESCFSVSVLLHFIFQEHKDTRNFRRWAHKRLQLELNDITTRFTGGRLIQDIRIRDLTVGNQFPIIDTIRVEKAKMSEDKQSFEVILQRINIISLQSLDIIVDVEYNGGFQASVDVTALFGSSAQFAVKLTRLAGKGRLTLTRIPYNHWSFAFVEMPELDFKVESQIRGRDMKRLIPLVIQAFRMVIQRKHVWPNYKIRYRPIFPNPLLQPSPPISAFEHVIVRGGLEVTVLSCSRLNTLTATAEQTDAYCTISLGKRPFLHHASTLSTHCISVLLNFYRRSISEPLGLSFVKSVAELGLRAVQISQVEAGSEAEKCGFRSGDVVMAVNNVPIRTERQAHRLLSATNGDLFVLVERSLDDEGDEQELEDPHTDNEDVMASSGIGEEDFVCVGGKRQRRLSIPTTTAGTIERPGKLELRRLRKSQSATNIADLFEETGLSEPSLARDATLKTETPVVPKPPLLTSPSVELRRTFSDSELLSSSTLSTGNTTIAALNVSSGIEDEEELVSAESTDRLLDDIESVATPSEANPAASLSLSDRQTTTDSSISSASTSSQAHLSKRERLHARAVQVAGHLQAGKEKMNELWHRHRKEMTPQVELAMEADLGNESAGRDSPLDSALFSPSGRRTPAAEVVVVDKKKMRIKKKKEPRSSPIPTPNVEQPKSPINCSKDPRETPPPPSLRSRSTKPVRLNKDILWGQSLHFDLDNAQTRYMNITVHARVPPPQPTTNAAVGDNISRSSAGSNADEIVSPSMATTPPPKPVLLGYTSVYVAQLIDDCRLTLSNCHRERFTLRPPCATAQHGHLNNELSKHHGFDARLCYGDITLGFRYFPDGLPEGIGQAFGDESSCDEREDVQLVLTTQTMSADNPGMPVQNHKWVLVKFKTASQLCAMCRGKIWLRSARRCSDCHVVCHDKCTVKAATGIACNADTKIAENDAHFEVLEDLSDLRPSTVQALDGANAVYDDAVATLTRDDICTPTISEVQSPTISNADPGPSPQPRRRRLAAKVTEKFSHWRQKKKPTAPDFDLLTPKKKPGAISDGESSIASSSRFSTASLDVNRRHSLTPSSDSSEPLVSVKESLADICAILEQTPLLDEMLYEPGNAYNEETIKQAKHLGRRLFAELPTSERKLKINEQIDRIKSAMETTKCGRLQALTKVNNKSVEPVGTMEENGHRDFALLDDRLQALAVLMLHYCAGLQDCVDQEELQLLHENHTENGNVDVSSLSSSLQDGVIFFDALHSSNAVPRSESFS